jgi:hypothetical protein
VGVHESNEAIYTESVKYSSGGDCTDPIMYERFRDGKENSGTGKSLGISYRIGEMLGMDISFGVNKESQPIGSKKNNLRVRTGRYAELARSLVNKRTTADVEEL